MRLSLISEYFYPDSAGGTPTVLSHLARYLKDNYSDVQLEVIASDSLYRGDANSLSRFENWNGIRIHRLRTPKSNRASTVLRLAAGFAFSLAVFWKLLRRPRPDLLFIVTNPPTLPLAVKAYGRLRRVPYVYLVHDLYPDIAVALEVLAPQGHLARLLQRLQRSWLHSASKVVVLGRCMQDYLVEHYALRSEHIEVITNWSNGESIFPLDKSATVFRQKNKLSGFVVLYAGGFGQYQNFDCILDAAKQIGCENKDITFVFVGEGARKKHIEARIEQEGLSNVKLLPFVPDDEFADMLSSANVSLVTLEAGLEGLGVPSKFYNILASGRATVALVASNSEVARVIEEARCGVRVEQKNSAALAQVLREMAANTQKTAEMGRNARFVFEQKYTLPQVAQKFHDLFQSVRRK